MDRRQFVKASAVTGASASLAACGNPEDQFIRFISDEILPPGIAVSRRSICPLCPAGCGVEVRVMEGDIDVVRDGVAGVVKTGLAKKLEGLPAHPVNQGKLCVRGQAAIQVTYHPDRIRGPLQRIGERGSGQFEPVSWDDAIGELSSRLGALAESGGQNGLRMITRPLRSQRGFLIREFLDRFGAPPAITFDIFGDEVLREANFQSFGVRQLPTFDIPESRYLLSFGADILGTWNSPVSQNIGYGDMRQGRPGVRGKFVQVEPRMSQTGANADQWVPARPGTEGFLALGMARAIMAAGTRAPDEAGRAGALIEGWSEGLEAYTAEEVETVTGVPSRTVEQLAREFAENLPAIAVIAGAPLAHTNGLLNALAVNALNALVGSVGAGRGVGFTPQPEGLEPVPRGEGTIEQLVNEILESPAGAAPPVQVLFVNDTNPVFGAPSAMRVADALSDVGYIVSFGSFLDETGILADLILPDNSFLESLVDHVPESGGGRAIASTARRAMRPLHDTRDMADVLLEVARNLDFDEPLEWETYENLLQTRFDTLNPPEGFDSAWIAAQGRGFWVDESPSPVQPDPPAADVVPRTYTAPEFDGGADEFRFHFLPYVSQAFLDGSLAHLPWLQELPDVVTTAMWSSWVEINPRTAEELGVVEGDLVEVRSAHGVIQAPALIFPGIAPDVLAMPLGQGHRNFTRYASGRGANPIEVLAPMRESETGELAWAATRVNVARIDGEGGLITFAGALREDEELPR